MVLEKLLGNAASAEQMITVLSQRLASLKKAYEHQRRQREQFDINELTKQNCVLNNEVGALIKQVEGLKFNLECIRVQNGVKSVPLPKSKPVNSVTVEPETRVSPIPIQEPVKSVEPKKIVKTEVAKDNKKDNAKSGKKKDAKPNEKASDAARPIDASRLDLRVGKIISVEVHPDADTLYIEKVDLGEGKPRTIVSSLVNHMKHEDLQDRMGIFMCNLKPVKMRGVFSEGMIMCASTPEKVWPISPPNGSTEGDKVRLQGYTGEPDAMLNPKKKIWEQIKPDMHVNADGKATYKGREFYIDGKGVCTSPDVRNCPIT